MAARASAAFLRCRFPGGLISQAGIGGGPGIAASSAGDGSTKDGAGGGGAGDGSMKDGAGGGGAGDGSMKDGAGGGNAGDGATREMVPESAVTQLPSTLSSGSGWSGSSVM